MPTPAAWHCNKALNTNLPPWLARIFLHIAKSCWSGLTGAKLSGCWDTGDVVWLCPGCAQAHVALSALHSSQLEQVKGTLHPQHCQLNSYSQLCLDFKGLVVSSGNHSFYQGPGSWKKEPSILFLFFCCKQPAFPPAAPATKIILGVLLLNKLGERAR